MTFNGSNWIGGARRAAICEATFERVRGERWPRSDAHDVGHAVRLACEAGARWRAVPLDERRSRVTEGLERACDDALAIEAAARGLGLRLEDLTAEIDLALRAALDVVAGRALDLERTRLALGRGPIVLRFDWTELARSPWRELVHVLTRGRPAIVLADGRAPALVDLLARAFEPLESGVFACLHDDTRTTLRAACADPRIELLRVATFDDESDPDFERAGARLFERPLRSKSFVVRAAHDLEREASAIARGAVGAISALSGVRPGSIGRVIAPRHLFSRASELVLRAIEDCDDVRDPLPLARSASKEALERAVALAHDEGATLVEARSKFPFIATNVDPAMHVAKLSRPLPLVRFVRVRDEGEALRTGAGLDRESPIGAGP